MASTMLGTMAHAVAAPLNPQYTEDELRFYLTELAPRLLLVDEAIDTPARGVASSLGIDTIDVRSLPDWSVVFACLASPGASEELPDSKAEDVALLLHTSGTTSRPKLVPLTHANLGASACNVAATLELTADDRCLNLMPLFHIHGLVAALLASLERGASVVCTPGFNAGEVLGWMRELQPTWYTAVPTIHRAMLDAYSPETVTPPLRFIRSSSAALPSSTLIALEERFGVPVVEAYGMTEAAHQIASNPRSEMRRRGSVGPASGPEVAILDGGKVTRVPHVRGEIVIRGANVMRGYVDNPEANAVSFVDAWFRTGDQGVLDRDGFLTITGRLKEIINRGGEKVAPTEVEEALLAHPDVDHAAAFAVPHRRLGEDVAAAVVLRVDSIVSRAELRRFVAMKLAPFKVPNRIVFLAEIPRGPTGKIQRIGLAERLGLDESIDDTRHLVEPRDDVERRVIAIFSDVLHLDAPVSVTDDFVDLGADSLHLEELLAEVETEFDRSLPASVLFEGATPERLATMLRTDADPGDDAALVPIQPHGSRPPLFCIMRANTLVTARHFVPELGPDQPVYGIWMPAMHGDTDAAGGIEEIAAACRSLVATVQERGPYYLFGYSTGGLVAYEMARQYAASGQTMGQVVMADTPYPAPLPTVADRARKLFSREGPEAVARRLRGVTYRLPLVGALPKSLPPHGLEVRAEEFSAIGVDLRATIRREREYVSTPREASAPVVILRCRHTMEVICGGSPVLGWEPYVDDDWEVHEVPGSHDSMIGEPHVHVLATTLAACLRAAQQRGDRGALR
jgi:acyl-CoA synthetase (AMP-forming)/AMP-acid ligase II/thioesterase domain-containing protein/acyl carrier protein